MNIEKDHNCRNDEQTKSDIEKHGLTVIIIEGTDYLPAFAYSIGLWQRFEHPEIICFGLTTKTLHTLVNNVADIVKEGKTIETDIDSYDIFKSARAQFVKVDYRNIHTGHTHTVYCMRVSAVFGRLWLVKKVGVN